MEHPEFIASVIFEENKFEGHTMLPVIDAFREKYKIEQLVIVADSGLLSSSNIDELQQGGYQFILGARIRNEKQDIQRKILSHKPEKRRNYNHAKGNLNKLLCQSSQKRLFNPRKRTQKKSRNK